MTQQMSKYLRKYNPLWLDLQGQMYTYFVSYTKACYSDESGSTGKI